MMTSDQYVKVCKQKMARKEVVMKGGKNKKESMIASKEVQTIKKNKKMLEILKVEGHGVEFF
jgi:hypothetical protein